jgi:hypothetical protein
MNFLNGLILIIPRYQNIFMVTFLIPQNHRIATRPKIWRENHKLPKIGKNARGSYVYTYEITKNVIFLIKNEFKLRIMMSFYLQ